MYDRMQELDTENLEKIHAASMNLLKNTGVAFNDDEALEIFKQNGHRVEGTTVFFEESDIKKALETAPKRFTVHARNPEKSVEIGEDDFVFLPGYEAPFVIDGQGDQRQATMEDYDNFCKLVQTSKHINMNGWMMVEPADMPHETVHLDLSLSNMLLCDKPFMGSPVSRQGALDGIEMAGILWGGKENIMDKTVSVSLINSLSPLQFSDEMAGALIELVRHGQACVVRSGINFMLHSCGILGSYIAMSFEKFIVDEEICGMVQSMIKPLALTDESIDLDIIKDVGIGGQYLTHPKTFKLCRTEFYMPGLMSRKNSDAWAKAGKQRIDQVAEDKVTQRLASYEKPEIDPEIEKKLTQYVENRKKG